MAITAACSGLGLLAATALSLVTVWWVWLFGAACAALLFAARFRVEAWNAPQFFRGVGSAVAFALLCPLVFPQATPMMICGVIAFHSLIAWRVCTEVHAGGGLW
jgi:hypothetical protein